MFENAVAQKPSIQTAIINEKLKDKVLELEKKLQDIKNEQLTKNIKKSLTAVINMKKYQNKET